MLWQLRLLKQAGLLSKPRLYGVCLCSSFTARSKLAATTRPGVSRLTSRVLASFIQFYLLPI